MPGFSRMQADKLLEAARTGRPVYEDLRPAYTRLDPLVALLRRRGFTGLIYAAGRPGEGVLWFERGRLHSGWQLVPGERDVTIQHDDPVAALRPLWADGDAVVAVHPAVPPAFDGEAARPASPAASGVGTASPAGASAPARPAGRVGSSVARSVAPPRGPAAGPPVRAAVPAPSHAVLAAVPWDRLLPEALARVRRHRGGPLASQLEEAVTAALAPDAAVAGREVRGGIRPERGGAALQAVAEGLRRVAGATFTERLLLTLGRDFACEDAVKALLAPLVGEGE
jgi:hypothetical protein